MRVWDIPVWFLCDKHLLGQHLEIHTIHSVIENNKKGYANHPETTRWRESLPGLRYMHSVTVNEMRKRGFNHKSPIQGETYPTPSHLIGVVDSVKTQVDELELKGCNCDIPSIRIWYNRNFSE